MNTWYSKKGYSLGPLDFPVRDADMAKELEALVKQAEANGLSYTRRFITADDIDTITKGKGDPEQLRHTALITASTNDVDRDNEIVLPTGIDRKMFRKNPVILWAHDSSKMPLGYSLWEKVEGDALKAFIKFADRPADHPEAAEWPADTAFSLVEQKVLRGVSIGFLPLDARPPLEKEIVANPKWAGASRVITKSLLCEISIVPVGCNQNALVEAVNKGLIDPERVKAYGIDYPEIEYQDWTWETEDVVIPKKIDPREAILKQLLKK